MTTFLCPIVNNPQKPHQSCKWFCTSSFSSEAEIIEHFKEVIDDDNMVDYLFEKFNCMIIRSARSADILSYEDYRTIRRYDANDSLNENFRNMSLNNDVKVKPNYDYFNENVYSNFFHFMDDLIYSENYDRNNLNNFYNFQEKKQQFDILRNQMGRRKLYNLFYFVRDVYTFLHIIEFKFLRIVEMFLYMDYKLKYGYYRDDINGKFYFFLSQDTKYTRKKITVSKF